MTVLRADARRNLGRVLDAAAEAFAELGPDVTVDEIARRAGVGHGTVFRRFPTKDALLAAVLGERLGELAASAGELLELDDAGEALERFVWQAAESLSRNRVLLEVVDECDAFAAVAEPKERLHERMERLVARARDEGAIRQDVDAHDVGALLGSAMQAATRAAKPDEWRRFVQVVLDGLRAAA